MNNAAMVRPRRHGEPPRRHGEPPQRHGEPPRRHGEPFLSGVYQG
jgi:hypothetical protein